MHGFFVIGGTGFIEHQGESVNHNGTDERALFMGVNAVLPRMIVVIVAADQNIVKIVLPAHGRIPRLINGRAQEHNRPAAIFVQPCFGKTFAVVKFTVNTRN